MSAQVDPGRVFEDVGLEPERSLARHAILDDVISIVLAQRDPEVLRLPHEADPAHRFR